MAFLHRYNSDDTFFRAVTVALLSLLNNKLTLWNRISDTERTQIEIPFFYDLRGDERFMQDIFYGDSLDDCIDYKTLEGTYDRVPRGHIRIEDITINTASLTSKFTPGEYRVETDSGELITKRAPINNIPLDITFTCEILVDSELDRLKLIQNIYTVFYKVHSFKYLFDGHILAAQTGFPESMTSVRSDDYKYGDDTSRKITFSLGVETYLPVVDKTMEMLKSNRIENIQLNTGDTTTNASTADYWSPDGKQVVIPDDALTVLHI